MRAQEAGKYTFLTACLKAAGNTTKRLTSLRLQQMNPDGMLGIQVHLRHCGLSDGDIQFNEIWFKVWNTPYEENLLKKLAIQKDA
jgi:hypothetical protein